MPLTLGLLEEDEIPAFTAIDCAAMENWGLAKAMSIEAPVPRQELIEGWVRSGFRTDPTQTYLKVTDDETGEIIACALWRIPKEETIEEPAKTEAPASVELKGAGEVENEEKKTKKQKSPGAVGEAMQRAWNEFQSTFFPDRPHANLRILITHPKHQHRGAGSMLTKWGCDHADKRGLITVLTASEAGLRTYLKAGFEVVGTYDMDLRPFGVDETEVRRWMIRQPAPVATAKSEG